MNFFEKKEEEILKKYRNSQGSLDVSKSQKCMLESELISLRREEIHNKYGGIFLGFVK